MTFKLGSSSKIQKLADYLGLQKKEVASADMVCGYTCHFANKCKAFANPVTHKMVRGEHNEYDCYGAILECAFTSTRELHWNNYDTIRKCKTSGEMTDILLDAIPAYLKVLRIHSFGDFFSDTYFKAWLNVTEKLKNISFFAYTKVLPYLKVAKPSNFAMVYSYGGILDNELTNEPTAYVVNSLNASKELKIPASCQKHPADDYDFIKAGKSFALILHGSQRKTAKALTRGSFKAKLDK